MRTSLTAYFKRQLLGANSDEVGIGLLSIACDSFPSPGVFNVCDNNEDVVSNGTTYSAYAFELGFCDEVEGEIPNNVITIDNVDPAIWEAIRSANARDAITLTYQFVAASDPDTNQLGREIEYTLIEPEADAINIVGSLLLAVITNETWPRHKITQAIWPGLTGGRAS